MGPSALTRSTPESLSGCEVVTPPFTCCTGLASVLIASGPIPAPPVGIAHPPDQLPGTSAVVLITLVQLPVY